VQKKVYAAYVLVEMILDPDSWYVVPHNPWRQAFVGRTSRASAASRSRSTSRK